jgi:hypothetical protein
MASKTVWIVGGLVVAIGVVAYVALKPGPVNTDAAGTIVEAKRARADGTNSFNPSPTASTTEQNASDASKAMAGPDAAKDAAGAAGGSGNGGKVTSKATLDSTAAKYAVSQAADADQASRGDTKGHDPRALLAQPTSRALESQTKSLEGNNPR